MLREEYNVGTMVANPPVWEAQPYIHAQTVGQIETLPVSVETAKRLFCISLHPLMNEEENTYVAAAIWDAVERVRKI
jgi:dTDP-4-amino-4,6-dideoxygalactose transaminase